MKTDTTKQRREAAKAVKALRDGGSTWADVEAETGVKPDLGRTLLKELAANGGKAAKVEPPKEAPKPVEPKEDEVAKARRILSEPTPKAPAKRRSGVYLKATCKCDGANVIRCSATVLERGITCDACGTTFKEAR